MLPLASTRTEPSAGEREGLASRMWTRKSCAIIAALGEICGLGAAEKRTAESSIARLCPMTAVAPDFRRVSLEFVAAVAVP